MIINKIWPIMFLLPLVVMSGCTEKPIGGETDEHGWPYFVYYHSVSTS
jgi:hypothetical protein